MSQRARRDNFYEDDVVNGGATERQAHLSLLKNHPEPVYETIHVEMDDEDKDGEAGSVPAAKLRTSSSALPSLEELREGVELSKREIHRIDALILRAVWKHLVARQSPARRSLLMSGGEVTDCHDFAKERQRRRAPRHGTEVEAIEGGDATAAHRAFSYSDASLKQHSAASVLVSRDPTLISFSHIGPPSIKVGQSGSHGHSALVYHNRPFLPPSRYPELPEPNSNEYEHFNRNLFRAVVDAGRRGLIDRDRGERAWAAAHKRGKEGESARLSKTLFTKASAESARATPSLRESALRKAVTTTDTISTRRAKERQPSSSVGVHTATPAEEVGWTPSLSVLILQLAKERAMATLFLRQLRLNARLRRNREVEIDYRFQFYLQRRVLRAWQKNANLVVERRHAVLSACVDAWRSAVTDAKRLREMVTDFREGLRARQAAFSMCLHRRKRKYLEKWADVFTARRVERSLNAVVDEFRERRKRSPHAAKYISLSPTGASPSVGLLTDLSQEFVRTRTLLIAFNHWRRKLERQRSCHEADRFYSDCLRRQVIRVFRSRIADAAIALGARRSATYSRAREAAQRGMLPEEATLEAARRRTIVVHVVPTATHTLKYKERSATRIGQGKLLHDSFFHWRTRAAGRCADALRAEHLRGVALRRWLSHLAHRQQSRRSLAEVWLRWRCRFFAAQDARAADEVRLRSLLHRAFSVRWRSCFLRRKAERREMSLACLRCWWERASLRAAGRVLQAQRKAMLFDRWRRGASVRVGSKTAALVADTVRETILLLSSLRWWRDQAEQARQTRLSAAVLSDLRNEKCMALCFAKWKRRVFGPRLPPPLPAPPTLGAPTVTSETLPCH